MELALIIGDNKTDTKNKRILAVDFGLKRVGLAVTDEFHISIRPIDTLLYTENSFWNRFFQIMDAERIGAILIGVPIRNDDKNDKLIREIDVFISKVKEKYSIDIIKYDEFMSSKKASAAMIEIGKKKKNRAEKGSLDKVAAAIILRDYLNDTEGGF